MLALISESFCAKLTMATKVLKLGVGMCIAKALNYVSHWCTCLAVFEDAVQGLPSTWELKKFHH